MSERGLARRASARCGGVARALIGLAVISALTIGALVPQGGPAVARSAPESFADLAEQLLPSVVNIATTQTSGERGQELPQFPPGTPWEDLFRDFFERQQRRDRPRRATSLGSGFIIDAGGLVVTNNHVIEGADEIRVVLHDDTELDAEVVGRDPKTDIAVLQVETDQDLPAITWGNSEEVRVGDWVVAIGNPFGLGGTVTAGILSARQRDINAGPYDDFLQTDASINRGNSGGPMFNMDGRVIGINTAIFSPSGGSVGIGFAIPSTLAKRVVQQLRIHGRTRRGWLGVRIQEVTDDIAETLGLDRASGALVASVTPDGPAEDAGIEKGDVILRFNGRDVEEMRRLPRMVAETDVGIRVPVDVWRESELQKFSVTLGELEEAEANGQIQTAARPEADEEDLERTVGDIGLTLSPLDSDSRERFGIDEETIGVVVSEVDPDGPAGEKDIREGDVIVEVGQEEVSSPQDVAERVRSAKDDGRKSVLLLVDRQGQKQFFALRIDG